MESRRGGGREGAKGSGYVLIHHYVHLRVLVRGIAKEAKRTTVRFPAII